MSRRNGSAPDWDGAGVRPSPNPPMVFYEPEVGKTCLTCGVGFVTTSRVKKRCDVCQAERDKGKKARYRQIAKNGTHNPNLPR